MAGNLPMASKMLDLQQIVQGSWKESILNQIGTKCPCCLTIWLKFVMLWSNEHGNVQSLYQLCQVWCFWANMAVLAVYHGQNLTDCLVLGINWLRPNIIMQNILPEIIGLVSWMSTVLCRIPDSFSSLGFEPSMNWLYAWRSWVDSFSYPSGHWISYEHSWVTLAVEPLLFLPPI